MRRLRSWLLEDRPATADEVRIILRAPRRLFAIQIALWFVAATVFGVINATFSGALAVRVVITVVIAGLVTAASAYLLTELLLRPAAARALADGAPERLVVPGVASRTMPTPAQRAGEALRAERLRRAEPEELAHDDGERRRNGPLRRMHLEHERGGMRREQWRERRPRHRAGAGREMQIKSHRLNPAGPRRARPRPEVVVDAEHDDGVEEGLDQLGEVAAGAVRRDVGVTDIEAHPDLLTIESAHESGDDPRIMRGAVGTGVVRRTVLDRDADPGVPRPAGETPQRALVFVVAAAMDHEQRSAGGLRVPQRALELHPVPAPAGEEIGGGVEDEPHPGEMQAVSQSAGVGLEQVGVAEQLAGPDRDLHVAEPGGLPPLQPGRRRPPAGRQVEPQTAAGATRGRSPSGRGRS